ncbi:la-related protein 6-like [Amphiprion ocellaris]|uniref:la-related protein 6-like n=1 Tax=Amphiprion ocellaris TaxID=80972 RepID=UPI000C303024|nr:la-related protein 6-like [Amphiprion ocellaris]
MSNPKRDDTQTAQDEEDREVGLLCLKIKDILEDLFSESHLAKDGFLLKHVQKTKQGYVSLKLLTCLKKIKALTTNWDMTLVAATYSDLLEVNDERTKVRRIKPLPQWLLCSPTSKFLLTWNIFEDQNREDGAASVPEHPSLSERVLQRFSIYGSVTSVWILHPGEELPRELQCYAKCHKELGQHLCAVVKLDNLEAVREAFNALKAEEEKSKGKGIRVVPLGFKGTHRFNEDKLSEENSEDHFKENSPFQEHPPKISKDFKEPSSPVKVSDKTGRTHPPQTSSDHTIQRTFDQMFSSCDGKCLSGLNQRYSKMSWCSGDCDKESSQSPWVLRRKLAADALNPKVMRHLNAPWLMQTVLRQPFGPDGTKGFQGRRSLWQQKEISKFVKQYFSTKN